MKKVVVVLGLSNLSIPEKLTGGRFIVTSMTGNPNFTNPNPALDTVTRDIDAMEHAAVLAAGGGTEETATMHSLELKLDLTLKLLAAYVENVANADPVRAEAIVLSAGMGVKAPVIHTAKEFSVSVTKNPGELRISTKHAPRATFIFQLCTDPGNEASWQTIAQSTRAKFVKSGLISGTRYYFRVAVIDKNGMGPWSNVLNSVAL